MEKPFPAYDGDEPYAFVCYAHRDSEAVYADLKELHDAGVNLWYDEGISAGLSWRAEIATAISGASKVLFFISESSLNSAHCLREVDYALNHDIDVVPVYLEDCALPGELELGLNRVHALFRHNDNRYSEHLLSAMRQRTIAAPLHALKRPGKSRTRFGIAIAGLVLAAILAWTQRDLLRPEIAGDSPASYGPSAFDGYLEGSELVERWDKDDNLKKAEERFRDVISIDPDFALAYARLADTLRIQYALTGQERLLDEASGYADEAVRLNADLGPVQVALGRVQEQRGNMDLAFAAFERALSIDPNDAVAHQAMAGLYARQGRFEDAEASYRRALALEPDRITILSSYANFLSDQTRTEEAVRLFRKIIRLAPDHYAALVNLASVLAEAGDLSAAIVMYERAIEIRPSYMAYSNLGTAYTRVQRYDSAIDAYNKAIELDDSDWLAWGNLAYTYFYMGQDESLVNETFERAISLAEDARSKSPRDAYVHSDLALYYARTGHGELARERVETALALDANNGEILLAAAETFEDLEQRDRAMELLSMALEAGISRQRIRRNPVLTGLLDDPRLEAPSG